MLNSEMFETPDDVIPDTEGESRSNDLGGFRSMVRPN